MSMSLFYNNQSYEIPLEIQLQGLDAALEYVVALAASESPDPEGE